MINPRKKYARSRWVFRTVSAMSYASVLMAQIYIMTATFRITTDHPSPFTVYCLLFTADDSSGIPRRINNPKHTPDDQLTIDGVVFLILLAAETHQCKLLYGDQRQNNS